MINSVTYKTWQGALREQRTTAVHPPNSGPDLRGIANHLRQRWTAEGRRRMERESAGLAAEVDI